MHQMPIRWRHSAMGFSKQPSQGLLSSGKHALLVVSCTPRTTHFKNYSWENWGYKKPNGLEAELVPETGTALWKCGQRVIQHFPLWRSLSLAPCSAVTISKFLITLESRTPDFPLYLAPSVCVLYVLRAWGLDTDLWKIHRSVSLEQPFTLCVS